MASALAVTELPTRNPDPTTAKDHHVGNPPTAFKNPWPSFKQDQSKLEVFQLRFGNSPEKNNVPVPTNPDGSRSEQLVKVLEPTWGAGQNDKLRATWIGHASFLVETPAIPGAERGVRILFDPVFSERTSPFSFAGPKRYTPTPCSLEEVPDVDIIAISHNHYDHLDINTITPLYRRLKGKVHFFVPLAVKTWFLDNIGCDNDEVTELDWWNSRSAFVPGLGDAELTCCPAQHFSGRSPFDAGHTLWCSWALKHTSSGKNLYFAGDTAYQAADTPSPCPVFEQIGQTLGPFDLSMIPIGLYSPPRFAASVHVHPEQSLEIHKAVRSKLSVGMHYGTVRGGLSGVFEPVTDPPMRWRKAAEEEQIWCGGGIEDAGAGIEGKLDVSRQGVGLCHVGETVAV